MPFVPKAGEGEGRAVFHVNEVRDFCFFAAQCFPFVESIGGDDAAFVFEAAAKGGLFGDGFSTRVDEAVRDGGVFCPRWDQPPRKEIRFVFGIIRDGKHWLGWGNVKSGCELVWKNEIAKGFL